LRPRVDVGAILGLTLRSARAGAAALGFVLAFSSRDVGLITALLLVTALAAVGSLKASANRWSTAAALLLSVCLIAAAKQAAGPAGAAVMTLLVGLAIWLRIRVRDGLSGLAVFGALVALAAHTSVGLLLGFWLVGWAIALGAQLVRALTCGLESGAPNASPTPTTRSAQIHALNPRS
jgi:hypothetical protein